MKHLIKSALLIMALLVPASATAYDFEVDGIYYNRNGHEAQVTYNNNDDYNNSYSGYVVIPETVIFEDATYPVTSIGYDAFRDSHELAGVFIPHSVTTISERAFAYCYNLTSIQVDNGNPKYDSRDDCNAVIETASNTLIAGCNGTVIPNSVTSIGDDAFYECVGLTNIDIPYSVISIGDEAFFSCYNLTSVTIPYSVTTIGTNPFAGCYNLTSIQVESSNWSYDSRNNCNAVIETASNTLIVGCMSSEIPNSVTSIGDYAFYYCDYLTNVTIPNSVISIGNYAFCGCYDLSSIDIPNSVISIGDWAFGDCRSLTIIDIPNSVTTIGVRAFESTGWYNNQPDGLVYAGLVAYEYKGNMPDGTIITIKEGTLGIAGEAFHFCKGLESVVIPNSITTIGRSAFSYCDGLSSIDIPNSVTSIGIDAFASCDNLTNIQVAFGNPKYDSRDNCNAIIETASNKLVIGCKGTIIPNSVTAIGNRAFLFCKGLTNIDIPNSVTSIGDRSFASCYNLSSIDIPNSITSIDIGAFQNCTGLSSVTIPNSITSISDGVFYGCRSLNGIEIPISVTEIGLCAFWYCDGLKSIDIPNTVTFIGVQAFGLCRGLTSITIPQSVTFIGNQAFRYCSSLDTLNFNAIHCADFSAAESDHPFPDLNISTINIGDEEERIPAYFAYGLSKLTSVNISKSVTFVGKQAFNSCPAIETVICEAETSPAWNDIAMFSTNVYNHATLFVPNGKEQDYKTDECWGQFATILAIGSGLKGDVDGNGVINITDVTMIIDYLLGSDVTPFNLYNADVNASGSISIADVVTLIDILLGF